MSADNHIQIMCPNLACRKILAVPNAARGKTVRCRNCRSTIRIPAGSSQPSRPGSKPTPKAG